jgi:ATP-dependent Clp protease ATP-binding subunit ClpA
MKLLRRRTGPRARTARPAAEPYLAAGAELARRLGHNYVGTEHVLSVLVRDPQGAAARLLAQLGITVDAVEGALACWLTDGTTAARIDPRALAELGIDFEAVRERLERTFGPGALERTRSGCLGICPRLKMALAYALDHSAGRPLGDEHVLLGMLNVPDSVAARVLGGLGVSQHAAEAIVTRNDE